MANSVVGNPVYIDTASGSTLTGIRHIQEIQWVDKTGDIVHDDDLSITMNGVTVAVKPQLLNDNIHVGVCIWRMGPWAKPIPVTDFVVNTIDHGAVLVFLE